MVGITRLGAKQRIGGGAVGAKVSYTAKKCKNKKKANISQIIWEQQELLGLIGATPYSCFKSGKSKQKIDRKNCSKNRRAHN